MTLPSKLRPIAKKALAVLTRPFEIDRFLSSLPARTKRESGDIDDLLRDSQINAISAVVADQIVGWGMEAISGRCSRHLGHAERKLVTRSLTRQ